MQVFRANKTQLCYEMPLNIVFDAIIRTRLLEYHHHAAL